MSIFTGPLIEFTYGLQGSYLLFLYVSEEISIDRRGELIRLEKGFYIYVGSAFGTGGLSSRLHRHVRKKKKKHWHIDQITMHSASSILGIGIAINKREECKMSQLLNNFDSLTPILGIGNSDCTKNCLSHFLKLEEV
jgi:Uri superfamily endonuclease